MKDRLYKIDNLKFILILLVVFGHFIELTNYINITKSLFVFIYSFHMPLFIFISGLFSKKILSVKEYPYKKILFYIYLIFFMKISVFSIHSLFNADTSFSIFGGTGYYWYLGVIIIYTLLIPFIEKTNKNILLIFSIVLGIFAGYDSNIPQILFLGRIFSFFPFFLSGYILKDEKEKIINFLNKKQVKYLSITLLIEILVFMIIFINYFNNYRMVFTSTMPYSLMVTDDGFYITYKIKIIAYIITLIASLSVFSLSPNKKIKYISTMGSKTLPIYVLHMPILSLMKDIGLISLIWSTFKQYSIIIYFILSIIIVIILSDKHIENLFIKIKNIV